MNSGGYLRWRNWSQKIKTAGVNDYQRQIMYDFVSHLSDLQRSSGMELETRLADLLARKLGVLEDEVGWNTKPRT